MKLPMSYTPLSLSEAHRRRARRQTQFLVHPEVLSTHECTENEDELEEQL